MEKIVQRLEQALIAEFKRGSFKGLSDETVLRVMFAYASGYLNGFDISFTEVYNMLMRLFDDAVIGELGVNK